MILGMTVGEMAVFGGACLAAAATQSLSSFGFGVVLVGLLPIFGVPIPETVVLVTLLVVPNLAIAVWRLRREASVRRVAWLLAGVPLGIPFGIYLLTAEGLGRLLRGLLGLVLIFAAVAPFLLRRLAPRPERRRWAFTAGVASGALGAALSTGGPPVVIYFYRRQWPKELTKACVMLTFVGTVSLRLIAYVIQTPITGKALLTGELLLKAAVFSPAVVAGTILGEGLFGKVSQRGFRWAVAAMLIVCGAYQLGKAMGAW